VPLGYVSGGLLSDTSTYDNATLASLGLTVGDYLDVAHRQLHDHGRSADGDGAGQPDAAGGGGGDDARGCAKAPAQVVAASSRGAPPLGPDLPPDAAGRRVPSHHPG
jgi:hypothetical protein